MDREGFRNRLKQYKQAREENPGLKYWEWKDIPKYDEGTNGVTLKEKEDAFWRGDTQKMAELVEREGKQLTYVTPQSNMDEVVITANKPKQTQYSELDFAKDVAGFLPVLGDAVDIYDAGKALYNGNYSQAALFGAGLLLPNWLEKGGKYLYKGIRNNWRRFKRNLHMYPSYNNKYMLGESVNSVANRVADNEVRKSGIEEYIYTPFFKENDIERIRTNYVNAQQRNTQSAKEAIKAVQVHNIGKFTPTQLREINEIFKEDPRYADFILSHPELNPLDAETVDRFITKQNSFIRGVHSNEDNDLLIQQMLTENPSDASKKVGGDRLGTDSRGIYVSNSGEIADRFQRSIGSSVRSDIGFLQKTPATDVDTPIRERLAAERRRIFPFDIVSNAENLSYKDLVDLGYVAKEAQYTTRFGNKLPGYERAYISNTFDTPTLTINDLQTVKGNLKDKKGRWGIGGVSSVPELEDQLFDGLNIGTSYGDFLHLMRALKSPNLTTRRYNFDFGDQVYKRQRELNNLFGKQVDKQIEIKNKILKNPYLRAAQNVYLNRGPIFGISGTLGVTGASVYGIMNSPNARQRDRFQNAMEDDEFAEWYRNSSISPNDYSNTTSYVDALMKEWNKQNPNKSFAEGGEVTGPPTYEQWNADMNRYNPTILDNASMYWSIEAAKKALHNEAMKLPGYAPMWHEYVRSLPKADPDINQFVDDLWANENPNNVGYRNGKYYPHKSPEGGKMTIGPGFKLDSGSHGVSTKAANRGMTKTRLDQEARKIGKQHLKAVDQFINYGQTTNPADTVSPQIKMGLMDLRHQVGPLNEWGNLRQAVLEGDLDRIKKESTVTWNDNGKTKVDKRRKKIRDEKYFYYE